MTEIFMINQLMVKLGIMMKLEKLQQQKKMMIQTECFLDFQYFKDHYQLIAVKKIIKC